MTTAASPGPSAAVDAAIASAASKAIAIRGIRCGCLTKVAIRVTVAETCGASAADDARGGKTGHPSQARQEKPHTRKNKNTG